MTIRSQIIIPVVWTRDVLEKIRDYYHKKDLYCRNLRDALYGDESRLVSVTRWHASSPYDTSFFVSSLFVELTTIASDSLRMTRLITRWRSVKSYTSTASSSHRGHAKTWKIHVELSSRTIQNSYPTARQRSWEYQELHLKRYIHRTHCEIILKTTQRMKLKRIEWWNVLTDSTKFHFWK